MKLNNRLKMIADMIPQCRILSDIGTDHAYLPIYAVMNGVCEKSLAVDLRHGPLEIASANIKKYGLDARIEIRQGSGLEPVHVSECDVIIIAGMGGALIREILSASPEKAKQAAALLLQPNNAADALRRWLYESGYDITEEKLVEDAGKLYCIIKANWTGVPQVKDEFTYHIGEKVFEGNGALLCKYLRKNLKEFETIIAGRSKSGSFADKKTHGVKTTPVEEIKSMTDGMNTSGDPTRVIISTETCIYIRNRLVESLKIICGFEPGDSFDILKV